ncbi:MAG: hypothetical protein IPG45_05995 [Deltaproteobacteria bacterium]|nr:hypothetical protein [Deltaproteobacteria bacterium]
MVLDGRAYNSRLPLVSPIAAHPNYDSTGAVLGGSVAASYQHLRHSARLIGHTTYPQYLRQPRAYNDQSWSFASTTYVQVAEHAGVLLPSVMTHVWARVAVRMASSDPATLTARVVLTDGTNTDTGDAYVVVVGNTSQVGFVPTEAFTLSAPGDPSLVICSMRVTCATARVTDPTPQARTVRVECHGGFGASVTPILVSVFWEADG